MTRYEYKIIPAPQRGVKAKGAKTTEARFAHALTELMNELGREGWEYQRSDTLPCEERVGLTGRTTRFQNMLVFRRALVPQFRTSVVPEFHRAAAPASANGATPDGAEETPEAVAARAAARATVPSRVTRRLAAALSVRAHEGKTPELRTDTTPGAAPRLGAAAGKGLHHPTDGKGDGPNVAAE